MKRIIQVLDVRGYDSNICVGFHRFFMHEFMIQMDHVSSMYDDREVMCESVEMCGVEKY